MAHFFIRRPVFAMVVALMITITGALAIMALPIARYPEISPPVVQLETVYTGASATVVEASVAAPIEQEINGVDGMIYMDSKSSNDGRYNLRVTFEPGTDPDMAAVLVQNKLKKAEGKLPREVQTYGITVEKQSPDMLLVISLYSPDEVYDQLFLSNYATINLIDPIRRVPGVGNTSIIGQRDYAMRMWLRPDKLAKLGLGANDIADVVAEQNVQAPAGAIGQPPAKAGLDFQYTVNVKGRLETPSEYEDMVIRTDDDGSILRMRDVARVELGAQEYKSIGRRDGQDSAIVIVYQSPGANAIDVVEGVKAQMEELQKRFPPGLTYEFSLDQTIFVRESIKEVIITLFEAVALVLLVVYIFLGSFRTTLIPMLAVPVSIVGTFAFFVPLGFSINTLSLFGMVLAIGIVVDDAIVVVEAVEVKLAQGFSPMEATFKAMDEVSGAIIATSLVLVAVFVPVGFMGGITGAMYKQFALTIAVSVMLSSVAALSLSPALASMLMRPKTESKGLLAGFFKWFNAALERTTGAYTRVVKIAIRRSVLTLGLLGLVLVGTGGLFKALPTSFVPQEDEGYFFVAVTLPDAASLERTDELLKRSEKMLMEIDGIRSVVTMGGLNVLTNSYTSNNGTLIPLLDPWDQRDAPELTSEAIVAKVRKKFAAFPEAVSIAFTPPPIPGLGTAGGFQFELQDRAGKTIAELSAAAEKLQAAAAKTEALTPLYGAFRAYVPQVFVDLDREKTKTLGIPIKTVFDSLQIFLGGLLVNDFNIFGRVYKVMVQAEPEYRISPNNIRNIYVRSDNNEMVPLGTLADVTSITGPEVIQRYNLFRTAELAGSAAPGFSSGQALDAMQALAEKELPDGFGYEWTGTAYQEKLAGGSQGLIFVLSLLFVFLFLAAQYESWSIPLGVLMGIPVGIFGAFLAVFLRGLVSDVYVQIGLIVIVGLATKNAILIVEYAKQQREEHGMGAAEAALEAARLRFRAILMTAFSFILGVLPVALASGAGEKSRHSLGTAVIGGMLAATLLGVFLVPTLDAVINRLAQKLTGGSKAKPTPEGPPSDASGAAPQAAE